MPTFRRDRDRRRATRLRSYIIGAKRRIGARNQSLLELAFTYVVLAVVLSQYQGRYPVVVIASMITYSAFSFMIWTVLENAADANEGSGFRLMTVPTRWRRNGLEFLHGLRVVVLSLLFAALWVPFFFVMVTLVTAGYIHLAVVGRSAMQWPILVPTWSVLFVLPASVYPVFLVHTFLMRRVRVDTVHRRKTRLGDRARWTIAMMVFFFLYVKSREFLIHLPFPLGPALAASLAILLTIATAALELSFRDQTRRSVDEN